MWEYNKRWICEGFCGISIIMVSVSKPDISVFMSNISYVDEAMYANIKSLLLQAQSCILLSICHCSLCDISIPLSDVILL